MRVHSKSQQGNFPAVGSMVFNSVFNTLDAGILLIDSDGFHVEMNDSFCRMTGYERCELIGEYYLTILPEIQRDFTICTFSAAMNAQAPKQTELEFPIQRKDGHIYWVNCKLNVLAEPDGARYMMVCLTDITGPRNYKQLLKETELAMGNAAEELKKEQILHIQKLLQQAEQIAGLGSWETNLKTGVSLWSDEMYHIFGWDIENKMPINGPQLSTIHPEDLEYVLDSLKDTIEGKGDFDIEHRIVRPNGVTRIIHSQGQLIKNNLGEPEKLIGVVHDITCVKQAEEQLRNHEAKLTEERVEHQRQIARATINTQEKERSEIGKELHDNVNQILASAKLFLSSPFMEGDERANFTRKAAEYIHTAIEEIRKLSKSLVSPGAADLGIIESIHDMIGDIQYAQRIEISFNHAGIDEAILDYGLKLTIYRIVQEQMNNILKHANACQITITLKEHGNKLILTIFDNGKGFDTQTRRRGIGLNNIINRADVFNGKVDIQSAPEQGCMVRVVFDM
jgi:PAS domain S-box-containing protein